MSNLVIYKSYSFFDESPEAKKYHWEITYYYRNNLDCITEEKRIQKEKNLEELRKIFGWLREIVD